MVTPHTSFTKDIPERILRDPSRSREVNAVFVFCIDGDDHDDGGVWTVDLKDQPGVRAGAVANPDCTVTMGRADWEKLTEKPALAMPLFFEGKIKVSGNPLLATKLQRIIG